MQKTENQQRNISLQLHKLAIKLIGPQKIHKKTEKATIGSINGDNTNTATPVDNINNLEIVVDNAANAATNVENIDTEFVNTDNINNGEIENDKSEDIVMSDDNDDNPAMSDKDSPHVTSGE